MIQGKRLFHHRRYSQASHCFRRANADFDALVARAYLLRQQARKASGKEYKSLHIQAAEAFKDSASASRKRANDYYRRAVDCYLKAGSYRGAARTYLQAGMFAECVQTYRKAAMFDEAVQIVRENGDRIPKEVSTTILTVSKLYYLRGSEAGLEYVQVYTMQRTFHSQSYRKALSGLFQSPDEALEFAMKYGLIAARILLLERMGRKAEMAELLISEGQVERGVELLLGDHQSQTRAAECILDLFWRDYPINIAAKKKTKLRRKRVIELASKLDKASLSHLVNDEVRLHLEPESTN
jgi:tetratricopeptide (TPR) repeat protein